MTANSTMTRMCLPSKLPQQCGNLFFIEKDSAIVLNSSVLGNFMCLLFILFQIAVQTSNTMLAMAVFEIRKGTDNFRKDVPVVKYL